MTTVSPLRRVEETPTKVSLVAVAIVIGASSVLSLLGFWKAIEILAFVIHHVRLAVVP